MSGFGYHDLERSALGFVLETETWPVFLAWVSRNHISPESHAWLATADLAETRQEWMAHSPDPNIREAARRE